MEQKDILSFFRKAKTVQLIILVLLELGFFCVILFHPVFRISVYSNPSLFILCAITWILMITSLVFIFYDFYKLKNFAEENHALSKAAYLDDMTGIPNKYSCNLIFRMYGNSKSLAGLGCIMFEITNLYEINDKYGHDIGDHIILSFCQLLEEVGDKYGFVGRNGGNEFLAVLENCSEKDIVSFLTVFKNRVNEFNAEDTHPPIHFASGYTINHAEHVTKFHQLITSAYKDLHKNN